MPGTYPSDFEEELNFEEISTTKMGETSVSYCTEAHLILGHGSTATVYPGYHFGIKKPAAVKHIRNRHLRVDNQQKKELEIWSKIDNNKNIIRLYDSHSDPKEGMFLAMEKAQRTFKEQILNFDNSKDEIITWLYQVTKAVEHLHGMGFAHKDIDPDNILMVTQHDKLVAKLADFGVSTMLITASEKIESQSKNFKNIDIFQLGKIMHFGLSKEVKIDAYTPSNYLNSDHMAAHYLIMSMMDREPNNQPDIFEVSSHCLFWNWKKVKNFFLSAAICFSRRDCAETAKVKKEVDCAYKEYFEKKDQGTIFNWIEIARQNRVNIIDLLSSNSSTKEYGDGESITKFIKLFRDKFVHHPEMRLPAANIFSDGNGVFREEIYVNKLTAMFPGLTAILYQVLSRNLHVRPLSSLSVVFFEEKLKRLSR